MLDAAGRTSHCMPSIYVIILSHLHAAMAQIGDRRTKVWFGEYVGALGATWRLEGIWVSQLHPLGGLARVEEEWVCVAPAPRWSQEGDHKMVARRLSHGPRVFQNFKGDRQIVQIGSKKVPSRLQADAKWLKVVSSSA